MPFEWQLPYNNNDNFQWSHEPSDFQGTGSSFWEDESPEAIANPQQFNKQPKKYPKIQKQKGPDNRLKSQDSAIHSSVFANQTEIPPMVPDRLKSSKSAGMNNPVNPFETVETPSEDLLFQYMLKPTFNLTNQLAPYNQLVEMPLNVQIDKLVESQKLTPEQLRIRWQLAFDLLYLLRYHYPTCEVYGIDSVLTHFKKADSCLSCDVQLYVDLTGSELTFEDTTSLQSIIQQVKSILGAHRCPHRHGDGFRSFIKMFIKKEKNDKVIQFMHEPSQLTCQLTFQSQLPAKRSQLIRYCIKLDPRISKFIGVLRYWGQYHDLCDDGNHGANKISEYALFLLGLVYLMEEKKMPPVANLPTDLLKPPSHQKDSLDNNSATGENVGGAVIQFMKGFCEKYANLDFKTVVVVPFTGKINSRHAFGLTNQGNVPVSVIMGAGVCIDPFDFKINVFECKDIKVALQSFQVACKKTVKVLEENGGHQDQKSIVDLFITRPQPKNTQMVALKMTNDFALVYMTKLASADKMLDSFSSVLKTGMMRNKLFNLWKKFAEEFILEIFPTGFKLPTVEEKFDGGNANVNNLKKLYRVSYPFWERLGATELKEEDYQCQDPIQVEKIKSTAILVNYLARKGKLGNDFQESRIQMEYKLNVSAEGIQEMQVRLLKVRQMIKNTCMHD